MNERLKIFISSLNISQREFCRVIGESSTFISSMRKSTSPEKVHNIIAHYPQLSLEWLMFGTGEMLSKAPVQKVKELTSSNIEDMIEIMKLQARSLSRRDDQIDELIKMLKKQMDL